MNFETNPYDLALFFFPPAAALASVHLRSRFSLVLAIVFVAFANWGVMFASEAWVDAQWAALMERTASPSSQLIEAYDSDGASKGFLLLFGFPFSLFYTTVSFVVVRFLLGIWRRLTHALNFPR